MAPDTFRIARTELPDVGVAASAGDAPTALDRYHVTAVAEAYARKFDRSWSRRWTRRREETILGSFLACFPRSASLLDVPCGTGRFEALLALPERSRTVFADASAAMLDVARFRLDAAAIRGVSTSLVDLVKDHPEEHFDICVCIRLLHHLRDPKHRGRVLDYLTATARTAVIVTYASRSTWKGWWRHLRTRLGLRRRGENLITDEEVRDRLRAAGFPEIRTRPVHRLFSSQVYVLATRTIQGTAAAGSAAAPGR